MLEGNRARQIIEMYPYLLKKLRLAGIPPVGSDTALEYSGRVGGKADGFLPEEGAFARVSEAFSAAAYGGCLPHDCDYETLVKSCREFPARFRQKLGGMKYAVNFFRL